MHEDLSTPQEQPKCPTCGQHLYPPHPLLHPATLNKEKLAQKLRHQANGTGRGAEGRHYKSNGKGKKKYTPIERAYIEGE